MNLLLRVGFMIKVSLFYKDSSAKGGITDLRAHPKMFHGPLAPSSVYSSSRSSKCFPLGI